MKIYINGKLVDKSSAKISVFDHGLLYGDGVFEGIRSYGGSIFKLDEHLKRLFDSAKAIRLNIPMDEDGLKDAIIKTLKQNGLKDAYIRLVVTRGAGDLGLDPRKCRKPSVIIITDNIALYPKEFYVNGLEIVIANTRRNPKRALDPQLKSLNYLNNILGKIEAIKKGVEEAVMLNCDGYVAECTGVNIFIVKDNTVITPNKDSGALNGITQLAVMSLARDDGMAVKERLIKPADLYSADECFLTGTAAEIIPVYKIDGRPIGSGTAGEKTLRLLKGFREMTKTGGVRY